MKNYVVDVISHSTKGMELLERWELERKHISTRDFRNIVLSMFYFAAESYWYSDLSARFRCDGEDLFTVKCFTRTSSSEIYSDISVARPGEKFMHVRRMVVAA